MSGEHVSAREVARAAGLDTPGLTRWVYWGYLAPDGPATPGTGNARPWTTGDLTDALLVRATMQVVGRQAGDAVRAVARAYRTHGRPPAGYIVAGPDQAAFHTGDLTAVLDVLAAGQGAIVVPVPVPERSHP